ncbi:hypothetical protein HII13_002219 [Brettanomyces bruxellensis]|nr:hypothetical protein HII13_002219 [Brettanomyces bruxellensis]
MDPVILKFISEDDLSYEEQLLKDPTNEQLWLQYYEHKKAATNANKQALIFLLYRGVNKLRNSVKLTMLYLNLLVSTIDNDNKCTESIQQIADAFSRASVNISDQLELWLLFCSFLTKNVEYIDATLIRRQFNTALQTLPIADHAKIWPMFLKCAKQIGGPTMITVYLRYCNFRTAAKHYDEYLVNTFSAIEKENGEKSVTDLSAVINDLLQHVQTFQQFELLKKYIDTLFSDQRFAVKLSRPELDVYKDLFSCLIRIRKNLKRAHENGHIMDEHAGKMYNKMKAKFKGQQGSIVTKYAEYWLASGNFLKVISTFEHGLTECMTIDDFTIIYDSYVDMMDSHIEVISDKLDKVEGMENEDANSLNATLNVLLQRYEDLLSRRPFIINDVYLRQDKNNVQTWLDRVEIYDKEKDYNRIVHCYQQAILTIDAPKVREPDLLPKLWIDYIKFTAKEDRKRLRKLYATAVKVPYRFVSDLEKIWCSWVEIEAQDNYDQALQVIKMAVTLPNSVLSGRTVNERNIRYDNDELSAQVRAYKSVRLWSLYLDIVESSDDVTQTCNIYDKVIELKIVTPLMILNYCNFLEKHGLYERCFQIYERGVAIFKYPTVFEIWNSYLTAAVKYMDKLAIKKERIRSLFDQSLQNSPDNFRKAIYLMYYDFEDKHGSKPESLRVLQEAIKAVENQDAKLDLFKMLVLQTIKYKGLSSASQLYEDALQVWPLSSPGFIEDIVAGFVDVEARLRRFKRCREILHYSCELVMKKSRSQKSRDQIWTLFKDFELENGDEQTYKEMLGFKRHMEAIAVPIIQERIEAGPNGGVDFVHSSNKESEKSTDELPKQETGKSAVANKDQIDIDMSLLE